MTLTYSGCKRSQCCCSISGGLQIADSFEVHFDGFEGAHTQQPIPSILLEQLCCENRVRFCWYTIHVRESWYVWFWGLTPDRVPLSLGEMGGPILGCSGDLNGCQITRGGFKRDA